MRRDDAIENKTKLKYGRISSFHINLLHRPTTVRVQDLAQMACMTHILLSDEAATFVINIKC